VADDSLIRLKNLRRLNLSATELSARVGGRYTYWRDMLAGKKSFGEKISRKIEEQLDLARGSLDSAADANANIWPFPGIDAARWQSLTRDQQIEIQGLVRERIERFEANRGNALRNGTDG
jgi:hypothetical protein